jgi:hypothetical protein
VLLVDDNDARLRERREDGDARPDHDGRLARTDASPLVGALPLPQGAVQDGRIGVEVVPEPVEQRRGQGDLGHQDDRTAARAQRRGDRRRVDRGLAAGRGALDQESRVTPIADELLDPPDDRLLLTAQARTGRQRATLDRASCRRPQTFRRTADAHPHRQLDQPTARQAADRAGSVSGRQTRGGDLLIGVATGRQVRQQRLLAGTERSTRRRIARGQSRGRVAAGRGQADEALQAWSRTRWQESPLESEQALLFGLPEVSHERRACGAGRKVVDRDAIGPAGLDGRHHIGVEPRAPSRADPDGAQLDPFEHPGRQHLADDHARWGEVVARDPRREPGLELGQQRSAGVDPLQHRPGLAVGRCHGACEHHAERFPAPVSDEHRLARRDIREVRREMVGVRRAARDGRRVDGDLDEARRRRGPIGHVAGPIRR